MYGKNEVLKNLVNEFQSKLKSKDPDNLDLIQQLYKQIGQLNVVERC